MNQPIYKANNPEEAHLLVNVLLGHGIDAKVTGENSYRLRGELPMTADTLPSIWVSQANAQRATSIVREEVARMRRPQSERQASGAPPWHCTNCEEPSEAQFTQCWSCGQRRHSDDSPESPSSPS